MDKRGSSSASKSRGRGIRPKVRNTQPQPTPRHQQLDPYQSTSQPNYYRPQPNYYNPQPPTPHQQIDPFQQPNYYRPQPPSPNDYFNPFEHYREQSDPFFFEDEEEAVPETQMDPPIDDDDDDDVQEVQPKSKKKFPTRSEKKKWTSEEEEALAKAWIQISTCRRVGTEQPGNSFWMRILEHFSTNVIGTTRSHHGLTTKWREMNASIGVFNGLYHQSKRLWESGCSDLDILKNAMESFEKKQGKPFTHQRAWEIVRDQSKWLEQKCVQDESSSHSDKRRKSSESGHYESGSNDFDTVLPNLNEDASPPLQSRARKGKKVASEASTKVSVVEMVQHYTTKKTQILEENTLKQQQLLDQRGEYLAQKALYQDHKFFNKSHAHITDPAMLQWTLDKKRELGAKYNWPCNF